MAAILFMDKYHNFKKTGSGAGTTAKERMKEAQENLRKMVLEGLSSGTPLWKMPWLAASGRQKSFATGKAYRGCNAFLLAIVAQAKHYTDNRWITFDAMKKADRHFITDAKGHGVPVFHYNFKDVEREDGKKETVFTGISCYTVFNVSLTDITPEVLPTNAFSPDEIGEQMLAVSPVEIVYGGGESFYRPSEDRIYLPEKMFFKSSSGFYGTAFHELVHATGAKKRLDRDLSGGFGSAKYAAEELVAEVGAVLLCAQLGIELEQKEETNHTAYLLSWLKSCELKDFTDALNKAESASDWLYGRYVDVFGDADYGIRISVLKYGTIGSHTGLSLLPVHEIAV